MNTHTNTPNDWTSLAAATGVKIQDNQRPHTYQGVSFVADLCRNHRGNLPIAVEMIHQAALAGATGVKIQADDGFEVETHRYLISRAKEEGLKAYVTIRNESHLLGPVYGLVDGYKVGSGECLNRSLVHAALMNEYGKEVIISAGGTTQMEWDELMLSKPPVGLTLCECTSSYPNMPDEIRLGFLKNMVEEARKKDLLARIGYSDHMPNYHMSLAAIALGAQYIEKHLSLDVLRKDENNASSISPIAFMNMVREGREIEAALKNTKKSVLAREITTGKLAYYRRQYDVEWGI